MKATKEKRKVFALPKESKLVLALGLPVQVWALCSAASHDGLALWPALAAFFVATYLTDLITALAHFGFDYVWPDNMPILGPVSVEFREHHDAPTLDPSAWVGNLTRGTYAALPFSIGTLYLSAHSPSTQWGFFFTATVALISFWGLFFHQIHSYTHMGKKVPPEEFNAAVARISKLPKGEQAREFRLLFDRVGIPKVVRFFQRIRLFIRPEEHWRHHNSYDSDFSSLNGWSDSFTNLFMGPIARWKMAQKEESDQQHAHFKKTAH